MTVRQEDKTTLVMPTGPWDKRTAHNAMAGSGKEDSSTVTGGRADQIFEKPNEASEVESMLISFSGFFLISLGSRKGYHQLR